MAKMEFLKEHEQADEVSRSDFPPNFIFGVATSAYQVSYSSFFMDYRSPIKEKTTFISCAI
jgi:hypothetical protein